MASASVAGSNAMSFRPCGLANQRGVCYSNAVLQCLARLICLHSLQSQLREAGHERADTWYAEVDITDPTAVEKRLGRALGRINPAKDCLHVIREMQNNQTVLVYPYYFQASLAAKGRKRGRQFVSGGGAYPFCWFRFALDGLCKGVRFKGQSETASHDVVDSMFKVDSLFVCTCRECFRTGVKQDKSATDWGLRLDPKGKGLPIRAAPPTSIQKLVEARQRSIESTKEQCKSCRKVTKQSRTWNGLRLAPRILCIEIKTYERLKRDGKEAEYKFLFSNIMLDGHITIPMGKDASMNYMLDSVVKLEGREHEHAVAYVQSEGDTWWKCSDEDITESTLAEAQQGCEDEQVSLLYYRRKDG
ncbi:hypothetical protein C7974DRAFT_444874 [Boeremia exigua]|uniref:uncharacterized protein n=1 Tax=Boeremia exigua TaxID=749465 RepID=UPI001E8E05F5|nr:uncharacterized protein C7974DRAFT_444874 [Boeremia exigua]KAH6613191.1 hypothetical protein C7974DRAFT_444874 [Boeremia exigua]